MTINDCIKILYNNLKAVQKEMFKAFFSNKRLKFVIHCSRRLGKTYFLCTVALIKAISKPNQQIRYAAMSQKAVRNMVKPIMRELQALIPRQYRGRWSSYEGQYTFWNGSIIQVAGVNNQHADDLRGTACDLALVDEAGFLDCLDYLIVSVLLQQLISTGGKIIMASSSPLSPAHDFAGYIREARRDGFYASYTIDDGEYPAETVEEFIKESGGRDSTAVRREYYNELIVDDSMAVIPEWRAAYVKELPPSAFDKYYHRYAAMDLGVRDKTAVLHAKYIFDKAILYIEHDWTCSGQESTTRNIFDNVSRIETELKYDKVYKRIADNNNLITLNDLNSEFNMYFSATHKDTLAAMVNEVRLWVQNGRIIIHPRCMELIQCLEFGVYADEKRKEFGRSKELGHYDALAALIYLVRNIDQSSNPIPKHFGTRFDTHHIPEEAKEDSKVLRIFNIKSGTR